MSGEPSVRRRTVLKRTGAAVAGVAGLAAVGQPAAAASDVPLVSTRGHFDDDGTLTSGHTANGYDTDGTVPGVDAGCADDLLVFVHGWQKDASDDEAEAAAEDKIEHADAQLDANGYDGTVVGFTYDNNRGGGWDFGWNVSQDIAVQNGTKLAQFLLDYKYYCGGTARVACHSLGAEVTYSALEVLDGSSYWDDQGYEVQSVHSLGAAVDNERPTLEHGDGYDAVANETTATFNYYSTDDSVLSWVYNTIEFDQALGETGIEDGNTAPGNYTDYDATGQVGSDHSGYLDALGDEIVSHLENVAYYD